MTQLSQYGGIFTLDDGPSFHQCTLLFNPSWSYSSPPSYASTKTNKVILIFLLHILSTIFQPGVLCPEDSVLCSILPIDHYHQVGLPCPGWGGCSSPLCMAAMLRWPFVVFVLVLFFLCLLKWKRGEQKQIDTHRTKQDHQWWRYHRRLLVYQSPYF